MVRRPVGIALSILLLPALVFAASPDQWVPARWEGGPLELARRGNDAALSDPRVREAVSDWYSPATLELLKGSPVNCLLVTFSAGAAPEVEKKQQQLVGEYAREAHVRGLAVLGLIYPGADPPAVASAAIEARLDGLVVEGDGIEAAERFQKLLRDRKSDAVVIPVSSSVLMKRAAWPVLAFDGSSAGVGILSDAVTASATRRLWVSSNVLLVLSLRSASHARPIWIFRRPQENSGDAFLKGIADAAAAGGRWVVEFDDDLRSRLYRRESTALETWKHIGSILTFFEDHAEWRGFTPFGTVGIVVDLAAPDLSHAEEWLALAADRPIPYRLIEREDLDAAALEGLRVVIAFELAPPTERERKTLLAFAETGGLVMTGPSWGSPPKEQSYSVVAAGDGEVAVYRLAAPRPASIVQDLRDLVPIPELEVNVFSAPSVLAYVSMSQSGDRTVVQLMNYDSQPSESFTVWAAQKFSTARLYVPGNPPVDLVVKQSGRRTSIEVPKLAVYGAILLE